MGKYGQFFTVEGNKWSCKLCNYSVIVNRSRGSIHFHIKKYHPDKFATANKCPNINPRKRLKSTNDDNNDNGESSSTAYAIAQIQDTNFENNNLTANLSKIFNPNSRGSTPRADSSTVYLIDPSTAVHYAIDQSLLPTYLTSSSVTNSPRKKQQRMATNQNSSPIVEMTRVECFSASHRLNSDELSDKLNEETFGKCNNINGHGHNYKWEVTLKGAIDAVTGMVYNMNNLKKEMAAVLDLVDHKNLDLDVDYFRIGKLVSTTENLAVFLYEALKERMELPELLYKVIIHETDKNSFTYYGHRSLSNDSL